MGAFCGHVSVMQAGTAFEALATPRQAPGQATGQAAGPAARQVSMKRRATLIAAVAAFAWLRTTQAAAGAPLPHLSAPDARPASILMLP